MFIDANTLQAQFDKLALQLRKTMIQGYSGGTGGSAEPTRRAPGGGVGRIVDSHRWRPALDVACQTSGGDSLVSLQFQLQQARQEIEKLKTEKKEMYDEMKLQVEELWKMRSTVQNMTDAQNRIHALESQLGNKARECDLAYAERDAVLRQNAFLQKEADRLLLTQTQAEVSQRMKGPSNIAPSPLHALRDSMMQRSSYYEALQIPSFSQNNNNNNNNTGSTPALSNASFNINNLHHHHHHHYLNQHQNNHNNNNNNNSNTNTNSTAIGGGGSVLRTASNLVATSVNSRSSSTYPVNTNNNNPTANNNATAETGNTPSSRDLPGMMTFGLENVTPIPNVKQQ